MRILGIETSCDECAAAVVEDGTRVLSNVVATQIPFHAKYDGVVPEIASRMHTEWIYGVVREALDKAGLGPEGIDGVAATARPGLLGSLLVGLGLGQGASFYRHKPYAGPLPCGPAGAPRQAAWGRGAGRAAAPSPLSCCP
jgi:N6-L-threonylcarbamoyladenine synthase